MILVRKGFYHPRNNQAIDRSRPLIERISETNLKDFGKEILPTPGSWVIVWVARSRSRCSSALVGLSTSDMNLSHPLSPLRFIVAVQFDFPELELYYYRSTIG